ncbi:MAG: hypothetical protein U1F48_11740 [Burkholderiales bacterium]
MRRCLALVATLLFSALAVAGNGTGKQTVCTVTVNSPDEKQAFQRYLPADKYQFVELVEHGREDWLDAACRTGVQCDVLVISGHYDGGHEFFSDRIEAREYLPVSELERASCSDSCPGLFAKLKEVYLFGCNTLNPEPQRSVPAEITRNLVQGGMPRAEADRVVRALNARHGASAKDRIRQVFKDVPAIYGFSSVAPLGPVAGGILARYFQGGRGEVGTGRANGRLISTFAAHGFTVTRGISDAEPAAEVRRDVCQFVDGRMSQAQRTTFVHELLRRPMPEVRMFLDRLEQYAAARHPDAKSRSGDAADPALADAETALARDDATRERFMAFARDTDDVATRARMIGLAGEFHWLTRDERRTELARMAGEILASNRAGAADVDVVCGLNRDGDLDGALDGIDVEGARDTVANGAVRACLGDGAGRTQVLEALATGTTQDVQVAQAYLRHQPIDDPAELRGIVAAIARMPAGEAQVRALQAIGEHRLSDPQSIETLARLFPAAPTWDVQSAIAGVLIRADYQTIARPEVVATMQQHRHKSPHGADLIDALIRRLQAN